MVIRYTLFLRSFNNTVGRRHKCSRTDYLIHDRCKEASYSGIKNILLHTYWLAHQSIGYWVHDWLLCRGSIDINLQPKQEKMHGMPIARNANCMECPLYGMPKPTATDTLILINMLMRAVSLYTCYGTLSFPFKKWEPHI